jgi:hypothetical protein
MAVGTTIRRPTDWRKIALMVDVLRLYVGFSDDIVSDTYGRNLHTV